MRLVIFFACASVLLARDSRVVERAWKLAADGQRDQAIEVLQSLLKENPRDADARLLLGSLLVESGKRSEAVAQLTQAATLRPHSAEAQNALGEALSSFGDFKGARTWLEKAVTIKPDFGVAQMNLGEVLLRLGQLDASAQHLDRATKLLGRGDDGAQARYLRGKVYTAQNDGAKAAEELQKAITMRPGFPEAWSDLGEARKALVDESGALAAFQRAVELNPSDSVAQYRLGVQYLDSDKPKEAIEHLQQAYRLNGDDQSTLNALQKSLRRDGRNEEADVIKQKLSDLLRKKDEVSQNAVAAAALNNEGASLQKAGDLVSALTKYRAAVQLAPQDVTMRVNLAIALLRLGQWTEGLNELHAAELLDPTNASIQQTLKEALVQAPAGTVPKWNRR